MTSLDYLPVPNHPKRSRLRTGMWLVTLFLVVYAGSFAVEHVGNATISVVNRIAQGVSGNATEPEQIPLAKDPEYTMPENDKNRLDILVLGIRGRDDIENGGLLTDTILLFSMDTKTGRASLVSIPRDLTVRITDDRTEKINAAYAHYGISGSKKIFSRILGVAIDNIVVADFDAFLSVVDTLGGITITLDKPFHETQQWGYEFSLPVGTSTLTGEQALYYARSRYTTSDFDRSRRQMQVLLAIKEKVAALSLTSDPLQALEIITTIRKHIETDLNIFDLGTLKDLMAQQDKLNHIKRYQLTTENILYETKVSGIYQLLPRDGTLAHIHRFLQTVLQDSPVLPTPAAALTSPSASTLTPSPTP